jgi:hypothetical protein
MESALRRDGVPRLTVWEERALPPAVWLTVGVVVMLWSVGSSAWK